MRRIIQHNDLELAAVGFCIEDLETLSLLVCCVISLWIISLKYIFHSKGVKLEIEEVA